LNNAYSYLSRELKNVENYNRAVANFSFGAERLDQDTGRKIHLLIIGETSRHDHWSVNGYARETSPRLKQQTNLFTFSNVASGGPMTHLAIPLIITRADAGTYAQHQKERSIFRAYKEVGYKTFWISNQSKYGLAGHIGMHYSDADSTIFNDYGQNTKNFVGNYDSALIPMVQSVLQTHKTDDLFIMVHTIGSHFRYLLRYPPSFSKFTPVSDRNRNLAGSIRDELLINEYDNSIFYTDFIINQLIETVKAEGVEASITYVSDHGENLNDDKRGLYFHSYNPTKYTIKVPWFVWLSDNFIQKHPEKVQNLRDHKDLPMSTASNTFFTLLDFANIRIRNSDDKRSIASDLFRGDEQKVLGENGSVLLFKDIK
jgi:glucan phosphoethanolaminetransferase (alkaline phosphatase superfamily)